VWRARWHVNGKVIMYADNITNSIRRSLTTIGAERLCTTQIACNQQNGIRSIDIVKVVRDLTDEMIAKPVALKKARIGPVFFNSTYDRSENEA
jgi:excinuclease UvrABC helicase subunit UvrB